MTLKPKAKFRFYLNKSKDQIKDPRLKRYVFRDDNLVYVTRYTEDNKNATFVCSDLDVRTGKDYEENFTLSKKDIAKIEEIIYLNSYQRSSCKKFSEDDTSEDTSEDSEDDFEQPNG